MPKNARNEEVPEMKGAIAAPKHRTDEDISPETVVFKTAPIKFKRPHRTSIMFDFEKQMGFRPRRIYIAMDTSRNNAIIVGVVDDDNESAFAKQRLADNENKKTIKKKPKKAKE